jgi:hypothetical protein
MLTEEMLAATIDALAGVDRLILCGDPRQLPPIGAGRPLRTSSHSSATSPGRAVEWLSCAQAGAKPPRPDPQRRWTMSRAGW